MALAEFNAAKYDLMAEHLLEVLRDAAKDDHQARGRACLVLADTLQVAGSFELARPWYELTRQHAVAEGDQATLSAYLYNVAAFRTTNLRLAEAFSEVSPAELKRASMEANSSFTYDMAVGSLAFGTFWKVLHGQLLNISGEYSEAKILLDAIPLEQLVPRDVPIVHCELGWCNLKLGNEDSSRRHFRESCSKLGLITESDDKANVLKRLSVLAQSFEMTEDAERYSAEAAQALDSHRAFQHSLMEKISPLIAQFPPPMKKGPDGVGPLSKRKDA